jgi:hypothetical protein
MYVVGAVLLVHLFCVLVACVEHVQVSFRRRAFRNRVAPVSDEDFLKQMNVPDADASIYLAVRKALAQCCGIESTLILPEQRMDELASLQELDGADFPEFLCLLEDETGQTIPFVATINKSPSIVEVFGSAESSVRDFAKQFLQTCWPDWPAQRKPHL